jgi:C1A family cysteine protease
MFKYQSLHLLRDKYDARDYIYTPPTAPAPAPALVDLRRWASAIEDQGSLGSCTGQAIAGAVELVDRKVWKQNLEISRLFIYYEERVLLGTWAVNTDSGAYIRDGLKVVNKLGAPIERLWPYDITRFKIKPTTTAYSDASRRKVTAYQRCLDFTAVKAAVAAGNPVVIGFSVYSSFYALNSTGIMTYPNLERERYLGGHAVCIVGYRDIDSRFIVRNSWGPGWGDNGYFYMPYEVIQNPAMAFDFWVISKTQQQAYLT